MTRYCKFCKQPVRLKEYESFWEIACTSPPEVCPYPPWISADTKEEVLEKWDSWFAIKKEK